MLSEHAVIVHYSLSGDGFGTKAEREAIQTLERRLESALVEDRAGELDGNDFGNGEAILYMYGANADTLYRTVETLLRQVSFRPGYAVLRYGDVSDPNASERRIDL